LFYFLPEVGQPDVTLRCYHLLIGVKGQMGATGATGATGAMGSSTPEDTDNCAGPVGKLH